MKQSKKSTAHILVRATTNGEWDNCSFAVIHLSEYWKKEQKKRLQWAMPLQNISHFCSMNFYDTAVDFYKTGEDDNPNIEELLNGKAWVFVELDEQEHETFIVPENRLDCYRLVLHANGTAYYSAFGKHTGEEFWTEEIDLNTLCNPIEGENELERFCRERFLHLSNAQLVARVNGLPDFGWDDEGVELQRRHRVSNGAFDYAFKGNKMVILKDNK